MSQPKSPKVLVRRPARITTDGRGRSVWADPVESAELELVSTQMLKVILSSRNDADRKAIARAANSTAEGVLARHPESGGFEIIEDDELQEILDRNEDLPNFTRPADVTLEPLHDYVDDQELSLVSTRALRKVLDDEDDGLAESSRSVGFNPYDHT